MNILKEAKIERFGHKDQYGRISTLFQITYIWDHKFMGFKRTIEEKFPVLFDKEQYAIDFVECGGHVKKFDKVDVYNKPYVSFKAYTENNPDYLIDIDVHKLDGYKTLYLVKGFRQSDVTFSCIMPFSHFLELKKDADEERRKRQERLEKEEEYIKSLHEVKIYKIQKA